MAVFQHVRQNLLRTSCQFVFALASARQILSTFIALIPRPVSYAVCILTVSTCLALFITISSCQLSEKPQMNPSQLSPYLITLYFTLGRRVSISILSCLMSWGIIGTSTHAQMTLPHYGLWLMSFQPLSSFCQFLHPSSHPLCHPKVFSLTSGEKGMYGVLIHPHTNIHRVHGCTMMLHTLSVLSTHTSV